ncbi:uncharacterized protein LOC128554686 [Mercenaria mercenaria]|uniref:uncharacterized protein LOC128554686 n=1 Tax=Mercenaria mercenaria TaxID=6596 RepID=UPI00234F6D55|nr:uncharacterized protein LOC128554686 [Mercenaria mercenaria]
MAALIALLDDRNRRALRRERVFRDHSEVLDTFSDQDLIARYRFDRNCIFEIIDKVRGDVTLPTNRGGHVIPPRIQVLVTLRYLAKGDFLSEVADIHGISRSSASRIIPRVCRSIIKNFPVR